MGAGAQENWVVGTCVAKLADESTWDSSPSLLRLDLREVQLRLREEDVKWVLSPSSLVSSGLDLP